jgi:hypothetical protein
MKFKPVENALRLVDAGIIEGGLRVYTASKSG